MFREIAIRLAIRSGSESAKDPTLYGHQLTHDAFWVLAGRWDSYCKKISPARIHPKLGWSQGPISDRNPMGLQPETADRLAPGGPPKILFYGDSYVDGQASPENWLPNLLQKLLPGKDVLHLGVGGYGTDQMHLLMEATLPRVDPPECIIMGVEPFSFDRSGLGVRSYQKPKFRLDPQGNLALENLPIDPDPVRFFNRAPKGFWGYAHAMRSMLKRPPESYDCGFLDKVEVNRALIDANHRMAKAVGSRLMYVIFRDQPQATTDNSRIQFFKEELKSRDISTFDCGPTLQAYQAAKSTDLSELYNQGHFNDAGNKLIAGALAEHMKAHSLAQ
ncbi:MAG: SGNH/GDSL hydrolase family protein [Planctomycetota bacterium]|nr:SGNH/GDSL hydrolase family protein [Planctomycetota bacterium]